MVENCYDVFGDNDSVRDWVNVELCLKVCFGYWLLNLKLGVDGILLGFDDMYVV